MRVKEQLWIHKPTNQYWIIKSPKDLHPDYTGIYIVKVADTKLCFCLDLLMHLDKFEFIDEWECGEKFRDKDFKNAPNIWVESRYKWPPSSYIPTPYALKDLPKRLDCDITIEYKDKHDIKE